MALLSVDIAKRIARARRDFGRAFVRQTRGNVAVIFGLSVFVILIAIGGAIDFSRVIIARRQLQDSSDAAVLRVMNMGKSTDAQRQVAADLAFTDNLKNPDVYAINKALTSETIGNTMTEAYTVSAKVTTVFGAFLGMDHVDIAVVSKAQSTMSKSEIAFVLDSTGSMGLDANGNPSSNNRMTALQASVDSVLSSILNSSGVNVSGTKVAIVPFNTQVKIKADTSYPFIDWGTQSLGEQCTTSTGFDSYACSVAWDAFDKVCANAKDVATCRSNAKGVYRTYTNASDGLPYYEVTYKAYEMDGGTYKVYSITQTYFTKTTTKTTGASCYTNETGQHCSSGGTSTSTSLNYSKALSSQAVAVSTGSNLNSAGYNTMPGGTKGVPSNALSFSTNNNAGYGQSAATSSVNNNHNGLKRLYYYPATADSKSKWAGCIIDRLHGIGYDYDASADPYTTDIPRSLYTARPCVDGNLKEVQALNDNITTARSFVKTMKPGGNNANTNVTIGIQWGMEVLSPDAPMTGGVAWNDTSTKKYMIVVTDGINNANRDYPSYSDNNAPYVNARMSLACANAKAKGITVFVVKLIEGDSTVLRQCASKDSYFYDLTSASQLNAALSSIFESIKKTRLTK